MAFEPQTPNFKSAIQTASGHVQFTVAKTETAAIAAVDRVEEAFKSAQSGFDGIKAAGVELVQFVDNAGRTTLGGAVAINSSLMSYGKDLVNDTIDVGRKTFETRSVQDAVTLHTAFAERRINAAFDAMAAINTLAQTNVLALWAPFASIANTLGAKTAPATTAIEKSFFKAAA